MPPDLPELTDVFWDGLAKKIADEILPEWMNARQGVEKKWEECDRAYLCERKLPFLEGFDYIDKSDFGSAHVHNGVNKFCIQLGLGIMDAKDQWLSVVGNQKEDPAVLKAVKAEQAWMHRMSETRRHFTDGLKQMVVRGINHWYMQWRTEEVYRKISNKSGRRALKRIMKASGQSSAQVNQIENIREKITKFNGPVAQCLDAFDVFMDPESNIMRERKTSMIIRTYMQPHEIENAVQDDSDDPLYENLDDLQAQRAGDVYMQPKDSYRRMRSERIMGINANAASSVSRDVIPVYILYAPHLEYEGLDFYDTYFYVARNSDNKPRLIRIEENLDASGNHLIITETFLNWFTHQAYGIGSVQTTLSAHHANNFLEAIHLNAMAAAQFPAVLVASGMLKGEELRLSPAAINEISAAAMGMNPVQPVLQNQAGVQIGFQDMEYMKQKIGSIFEVSGVSTQGQGLTPGSRETATSVNFRASSQGMAIDEHKEKFGNCLQKIAQWCYDKKQEVAKPDGQNEEGKDVIQYKMREGRDIIPGEILFDDWKRPRTVEITGYHGVLNQQQSIANRIDAMKAFGQMGQHLPNAPTMAQDLVKGLFQDLEVDVSPEAWMDPMDIAAANPQVQMAALQQALQNPEIAMQLMAQLGGPEDGQPGQAPGQGPGGPAPSPAGGAPGPQGTQQGGPPVPGAA